MGIREFLKKRRREKAKEQAFKRGEERSRAGKVTIPTTGGFVEVPKDSPLAQRQREDIERLRGGGGRSSSEVRRIAESQRRAEAERLRQIAEAQRLAEEKARKEAEAKRLAEQKARQEKERQQQIRDQQRREQILRAKLQRESAQRIVRNVTEKGTGDPIRTDTLINQRTGERIFIRTNLRTGETSRRTFQRPMRGGRARETGGITETKPVGKEEEKKKVVTMEKPPTVISLPTKKTKVFDPGVIAKFKEKTSDTIKKIKRILNLPELKARPETLEIGQLVPIPKEEEVKFIDKKDKVTGTRIRRGVDFRDIGTGRLPPTQELSLVVNRITTDIATGKVTSDAEIEKQLRKAEKRFVERETNRTLPAQFVQSIGIGALSAAFAPIGFTIGGLYALQGFRNRREMVKFIVGNPRLAAKVFVVNIAGGFAGARATALFKSSFFKIKDPTVKVQSNIKQTLKSIKLKALEKGIEQQKKTGKVTATNKFEIKVPNPQGKDVKIRVVQFVKDGKSRFFGEQLVNNKVVKEIRGTSLTKGKDSLTNIITNSVKKSFRGKLKNVEIRRFVEKINQQITAKTPIKQALLTKIETRLASKFKLKKLSLPEFRELVRRILGDKNAGKKVKKPFTETEFQRALKISKSQILSERKIILAKRVTQKGLISQVVTKRGKIKLLKERVTKKEIITKKRFKRKVTVTKPKELKAKFKVKKPLVKVKVKKTVIKFKEEGAGEIKIVSKEPPKLKRFIDIGKQRIRFKKPVAKLKVLKLPKGIKEIIVRNRLKQKFKPPKQKRSLLKKNINLIRNTQVFKQLAKETQKALIKKANRTGNISGVLAVISSLKSKQKQTIVQEQRLKRQLRKKQALITKQIKKQKFIKARVSIQTQAQRIKLKKQLKLRLALRKKIIKKPSIPKIPIGEFPKIPGTFKLSLIKTTKKLSKPTSGYFVRVKTKGKFVKIANIPLVLRDAEDILAYSLDKRLVRTGEIVPVGNVKTIGILKPFVKGYFNRNKKKLRAFKIRRGVKKQLIRKFIEKKKFVGDTRSEIRELQTAKRKRQARRRKRKISPTQRRILLKRVAQLKRQSRRKKPRQSRVNKKRKRTLSPAQLKALAKGRRKRLRGLRNLKSKTKKKRRK